MAEVIHLDKRDGYIYDPIVKGYDTTFWKSVTGTPTISSNQIQYNAQASASYLLHIYTEMEFLVTIPAVPTSGDSRQFGLKNPATNNLGAVYFDITGATFSGKIYDSAGNLYTVPLTFTSGWAATATVFKIRWEPGQILFYAGTTAETIALLGSASVGATPGVGTKAIIPYGPLAAYINNSNSDNLLVGYMAVRRAASII